MPGLSNNKISPTIMKTLKIFCALMEFSS